MYVCALRSYAVGIVSGQAPSAHVQRDLPCTSRPAALCRQSQGGAATAARSSALSAAPSDQDSAGCSTSGGNPLRSARTLRGFPAACPCCAPELCGSGSTLQLSIADNSRSRESNHACRPFPCSESGDSSCFFIFIYRPSSFENRLCPCQSWPWTTRCSQQASETCLPAYSRDRECETGKGRELNLVNRNSVNFSSHRHFDALLVP